MKVLIHSNAGWVGTGYGQQCAALARNIRDAGHDVAIHAFYGLAGAAFDWEGIRTYPAGAHAYGVDTLPQRALTHFEGDRLGGAIITLIDAWVLDPESLSSFNVGSWIPVDHDPIPPAVLGYVETSGCLPIAMSRFGEKQLQDHKPFYAPHSIDTDVFSPRDKQESRREHGLPQDAYIIGMVAANKGYPCRKGFPEAIAAFAKLNDPDAHLVLFTEPEAAHGINLRQVLAAYGVPENKVSLTGDLDWTMAIPPEKLAGIYSSFDVLLNPSYGEGFGITPLEAQACGVPVIVTDTTAMPEVGAVGWKVGGQKFWEAQASFWTVPNVDEIVSALKEAKDADLSEQAVAHAANYDHRVVFPTYWEPILTRLEERCEASVPEQVAIPA